jgi:hypothetical protein
LPFFTTISPGRLKIGDFGKNINRRPMMKKIIPHKIKNLPKLCIAKANLS